MSNLLKKTLKLSTELFRPINLSQSLKFELRGTFDPRIRVEIDKMQLIIIPVVIHNDVTQIWINRIQVGVTIKGFPFVTDHIPV